MSNPITEVKVDFRFKKLNKLQAYTLQREVLGASFQEQTNTNVFLGCVPLNDESMHEINDFFVRQMMRIEDCDIQVSVDSVNDVNSVSVPKVVNRMLKYIDCDLTYSFSVL